MRSNSSSATAHSNVYRLANRREPSPILSEDAAHHREKLHDRFGTEAIYEATLHRYLQDRPKREIQFFVNSRRFDLMRSVIGERLQQRPLRVLNAACGPFALEFYAGLQGATIDAFDIDEQLSELHKVLTIRQLITPCSFQIIDVAAYEPRDQYDVVLVNDLLYSKHVDFFGVIDKFANAVAPGGTLYFDIQDERAGPVWRLLGKGKATRRYNLARVRHELEARGFTINAVEPALGIKGAGIDSAARHLLWRWFGIANNVAFAATRTSPAA